jgi:hypothetical protein
MGYRCRWQTIGRNDEEEIEPLPKDIVKTLSGLQLSLAEGMKTIYDVYRDNKFIGQVRTTFGGQFFRKDHKEEFRYVFFKWNASDPKHGHALAALLDCQYNKSREGGIDESD